MFVNEEVYEIVLTIIVGYFMGCLRMYIERRKNCKDWWRLIFTPNKEIDF